MLEARVRGRAGAFALDLALAAGAGETLALIGESGAGKTSALRMLAGHLSPASGVVRVNGETWCDTARGIARPAWQRDVGHVAQEGALFPHLDVRAQLAFGPRAAGWDAARTHARVHALLAAFGLEPFANRLPHALSGGQRQRVALARALALEPALLLLDEPFAALDVASRRELRAELRRELVARRGVTVFVTHDPMEALLFGTTIAVIEHGTVSQCGTPDELLRHPRTSYVAELLGMNLFAGTIAGALGDGLVRVHTAAGELEAIDHGPAGAVFVALDPREVVLSLEPPHGTARNVLVRTVAEVVPEPPDGGRVRVVLAGDTPLVAQVTRASAATLALTPGMRVCASFKALGLRVFR